MKRPAPKPSAATTAPAGSPASLFDPALDHALLQALAPIEPSSAARERMLKTLIERTAPIRIPLAPPAPVTIVGGSAPWKPFLAGIERKVLFREAGAFVFLLRMQSGAVIPPHDHAHHEECFVLEGEVEVDGVVVHAGDFHFAPQGVRHAPMRANAPSLLYLRTAA